MTGEDFGYLIHQIPGTMFWLGVDSPYSLHSENMVPHTAAIMSGVNAMTSFWLIGMRYTNKLQNVLR